jgi:hypothetical protein
MKKFLVSACLASVVLTGILCTGCSETNSPEVDIVKLPVNEQVVTVSFDGHSRLGVLSKPMLPDHIPTEYHMRDMDEDGIYTSYLLIESR